MLSVLGRPFQVVFRKRETRAIQDLIFSLVYLLFVRYYHILVMRSLHEVHGKSAYSYKENRLHFILGVLLV
jgi:hypothetical protein